MNLQEALNTEFYKDHKIGDVYKMKNRDGTYELCQLVYYPLENYKDFTALVEINKGKYIDFREVPIRFLNKVVVDDTIVNRSSRNITIFEEYG